MGESWQGYYLTAYAIAVKHGYTGTEEEWIREVYDNAKASSDAAAASAQAAQESAEASSGSAEEAAQSAQAAEESAQAAAGSAGEAADIASEIGNVNSRFAAQDAEIAALRLAVGSPLVASTAAGMTNTEKIYVYVGSETGYTAGNWYYHDGEEWTSGGVYNSAAYETDKTLLVSDAAADAKVTGEKLALDAVHADMLAGTVFPEKRASSSDSGLFTLESGYIKSDTGEKKTSTKCCRTLAISISEPYFITLGLSGYKWLSWSYSNTGGTTGTHANNGQAWISGTEPIYIPKLAGDVTFRLSFTRVDNAVLTTDTEDETSDWYILQHALHIGKASETDTTLSKAGKAADAKAAGDAITAVDDLLEERTRFELGTEGFGWSFGGINNSGGNIDEQYADTNMRRLRLLGPDGKSGIAVSKGSTITAVSGYQFNVALCSRYQSAVDFDLVSYQGMTDSYTVPQDGYIRVGVKTTDNAQLWEEDAAGNPVFIGEAPAVSDMLTLSLYGGTVKTSILTLDSAVEALEQAVNGVLLELEEPPLNAAAYHALWEELTAGINGSNVPFADRVSLTSVPGLTGEDPLPVYLYRVENNKNWLKSGYPHTIQNWKTKGELYNRPKVLLTSGIHGDERVTPMVLFDFARRLKNDPGYQALRDAFDWYFVPLVNPWGFSHTAILTETSVPDTGRGYKVDGSTDTRADYTIADNTASVHFGCRRNAAGADANRDFESLTTVEAQNVRDAAQAVLGEGETFAFCLDAHMSRALDDIGTTGQKVGCSYLSLDQETMDAADTSARDLVCSRWMQAGGETMYAAAEQADRSNNWQTVYIWDGTDTASIRNYMKAAGFTPLSLCFEGDQTCAYYSKYDCSDTAHWGNPVARAFINTQYQLFLKKLAAHWM